MFSHLPEKNISNHNIFVGDAQHRLMTAWMEAPVLEIVL